MTATTSATAAATSGPDAGPPPEPLRSDRAIAPDLPREAPRDLAAKDPARDPKELQGYAMQAVVRTGEGPPAPKGGEVNAAAIETARRKTESRMSIVASQTRARFVLSGAWPVPQGTDVRARVDRYGHVVLLGGEDGYRVAAPGALRALLGERRMDVAPQSPADVVATGEGARRLNLRTRRVDVTTRAAKATLELAAFRDAGDGGTLVCRMLLDLMNAPPSTAACASDEVPLHAELRWTTRGSLSFDVTSIARRTDVPVQDLTAPPASAPFVADPPRVPPSEMIVARADLASFRTGPIEVPSPAAKDAQAPPPEAGLALVNSSDEMRVAWIDGVPVAWLAPGARESLPSLVRGRYTLQWRTFLGDVWEAPETVSVPGTSEVGGDGGAP